MRYFLSLTRPEATLTSRIAQATRAGRAVPRPGSPQAGPARPLGTAAGTVHIASVAMPADKDLAMAAGTMV